MAFSEGIQRTGSLIDSAPHEQLLKAFQKRNLSKFVKVLKEGDYNIGHYYGDPEHGTILDLICSTEDDTSDYLTAVLNHGADPNTANELRKKYPLHFIVENNNQKNLATLLNFRNKFDINVKDLLGKTALHYAVSNQKNNGDTKVLQTLLGVPGIDINSENRQGETPVYLAAARDNKPAVLLLVCKSDIDLDSAEDYLGKTARDLITENYPEIILPSRTLRPDKGTPDYVFNLLRADNVKQFKEAVQENKHLLSSSDGVYTLLQYACERGQYEVVDFLIREGVDVNETKNKSQDKPIMVAARKGYYRIVERFTTTDVSQFISPIDQKNVLHCAIIGSDESDQLAESSDEPRDHVKCLNILIRFTSKWNLLNRSDSKGYTPLHYAGRIGKDSTSMVSALLEAGAYVGCVNTFGDPALSYLSPSTFENFLNTCVRRNSKHSREESYEIIINYKSFVHPNKNSKENTVESWSFNSAINDTELLLFMSTSPDFKYLLMHPVLKSLIFMKWFNIRKWFFVNLFFYSLFWFFLSAFVLGVYNINSHDRFNETSVADTSEYSESNFGLLWLLVTLLLILLAARELFQLRKAYMQYLVNVENWLEVALIVTTSIILFVSVSDETKHQLSALAILFSWTELVLLIGKHPSLSTHIEMLKTVGFNFLKFLAWYSILIVAFALSFYTLFKNGYDDDDENKVFDDPGVSVFKTIVMLTGEFEAGEIPFHRYPLTGHMLFVLFVFTIAIVLYNLLNGLAVSDTQAIMSDAEAVGYISRVKLVSYVESIDLAPLTNLVSLFKARDHSNGNGTVSKSASDKTAISPSLNHEIQIYPNNGNRVAFSSSPVKVKRNDVESLGSCCLVQLCNCRDMVMDQTIVKSAEKLIDKERVSSYSSFNLSTNYKILDDFNRTLSEYKSVLEQMKETERQIRSLMDSSICR